MIRIPIGEMNREEYLWYCKDKALRQLEIYGTGPAVFTMIDNIGRPYGPNNSKLYPSLIFHGISILTTLANIRGRTRIFVRKWIRNFT